jgi:hypothetical protein
VERFLNSISDDRRRSECFQVLELMKQITKEEPRMWGSSVVGFGSYRYKYESGTKGEWFLTGFSPRKQNLTLYVMAGLERYPDTLAKLGKYKSGKSCLYLKSLDDVHLPTLKKLLQQSVSAVKSGSSKSSS